MPIDLTESERVAMVEPPDPSAGPVDIVLDTDTANEIDDQFALAYALLSPERLRVEAVYAAPFHNARSSGPADGMRESHAEILRVLDRFGRRPDDLVFAGSEQWLTDLGEPVPSPAVDDLIARARERDAAVHGPLYVVAIGAPTNVSSALLAAPDIARAITVVWLGGNPTTWHSAREFNATQDPHASRVLFDSGVPLVQVPCVNVTAHLRTTLPEVERFVRPSGRLGEYLATIYADYYYDDHFARSKVLWDIGAIAWLVDPTWTPSVLVHSPVLTDAGMWSLDPRRHLIRELCGVDRDAIFGDLFGKLGRLGA